MCIQTLFYETVDSVEFLDAVVQETLRLCSLTPKLVKINMHEIYSDNGYQ